MWFSFGPEDVSAIVGYLLAWAGTRAERVVDDAVDDRLAALFSGRPEVAEVLDEAAAQEVVAPETEAALRAVVTEALAADPEFARSVADVLHRPAQTFTNHGGFHASEGSVAAQVINAPFSIGGPPGPR